MVGADLRDPLHLRNAVAEQHEPVGARIGAVEHADAVRRRLDVKDRPDLAVHDGEGREGFHHLRVGLVDELAGQPPFLVHIEVAVLDQQRHFVRRPFRQPELALPVVAHDPEPRESRVDVELGDAHDVVVVPEQRRALVHRVVEDGGLAGSEKVLGPAVGGGWRETAVQVHDRVAGQAGCVAVRLAAAQAGKALHGYAVRVGRPRRHRVDDGERALQLVPPLDRYRLPALGLDRRARNRSLEAPDARGRQVAMELVRSGVHAHGQPTVTLRRGQP